MAKALAILLLSAFGFTATYAAPERHAVSPLASELTAHRVGDVLFRYIQFFEQYPCLRLETLSPPSFKRIDKVEVCKFVVDGEAIDVTKEKLTAVLYENFKLESDVFSFSTDIIFARQGYRYLNCRVSIAKTGKLSQPACQLGKRSPEPNE